MTTPLGGSPSVGAVVAGLAAAILGCGSSPARSVPAGSPTGGPEATGGTDAVAALKAASPRAASSPKPATPKAESSPQAESSPEAEGPPGDAAAANEPFEFIAPRMRVFRDRQQRLAITPIPIRLSDLPLIKLPRPISEEEAADSVFSAAKPAPEITVIIRERIAIPSDPKSVVVTLPAKTGVFTSVRIGTWIGWAGGSFVSTGGVPKSCSAQNFITLPARWEALTVTAAGADLTITDGLFSETACKAATVRAVTVKPAPIVPGGIVFAFRECGATCAEREELTLLFPRTVTLAATAVGGEARKEVGSYSRVTLPLRRGGGGAVMARLELQDLLRWKAVELAKNKPAARPGTPAAAAPVDGILFGLEVVQGIDDPEPIAIAYIEPPGALDVISTLPPPEPVDPAAGVPGSPKFDPLGGRL